MALSLAPAPAPLTPLSVRAVLALPELSAGAPRVLAAARQLDRTVRWVRVLDTPVGPGMLHGGELVLTTGVGPGRTSGEQARYVRRVARSGAAALVLELGTSYRGPVPAPIVETADRHDLPLIVLDRPVRFVKVTAAVHERLLGEQVAALRDLETMREHFTALVLDGAGTEDLLTRAAELLDCALFVTDGQRGLLSVETGSIAADAAFVAWEAAQTGDADVAVEAVTVRGVHRADVVALRPGRPFDIAERAAVRQVAQALGLEWLGRSTLELSLRRRARGNLLRSLMEERVTSAEANSRFHALGGGQPPRFWPVAVVLRGLDGPATLLDDLADGLSVERVGSYGRPLVDVAGRRLLWAAPGPDAAFGPTADALAGILHRTAARHEIAAARVSVAIGRPVDDLGALREQFETTILIAEASAVEGPRPWVDGRRAGLSAVAYAFKDDARLVRFGRDQLGALDRVPEPRRTDLLETLRVLLVSGGRKAQAARTLHLDRGALYKRMTRLEAILEADLDDAETRAALMLALAWHDAGAQASKTSRPISVHFQPLVE